jgi:hypothetical protein
MKWLSLKPGILLTPTYPMSGSMVITIPAYSNTGKQELL